MYTMNVLNMYVNDQLKMLNYIYLVLSRNISAENPKKKT